MHTYRQMALYTADLEQCTVVITCHMHGRSGEVELGYEILSAPTGEPVEAAALGMHWSTRDIGQITRVCQEVLEGARAHLLPF